MGYRIGNMCHLSKTDAEDAYFSAVVPIIKDGVISHPVRQPSGWFLNGVKIEAQLPECSPAQNFADGAVYGSGLILIAAVLMVTKLIARLLA